MLESALCMHVRVGLAPKNDFSSATHKFRQTCISRTKILANIMMPSGCSNRLRNTAEMIVSFRNDLTKTVNRNVIS